MIIFGSHEYHGQYNEFQRYFDFLEFGHSGDHDGCGAFFDYDDIPTLIHTLESVEHDIEQHPYILRFNENTSSFTLSEHNLLQCYHYGFKLNPNNTINIAILDNFILNLKFLRE